MEELKPLTPEELQNALNDFIDHFDADNFSEAALISLKKTFQTHNITIQDWNTLIEFLEQNVNNTEAIRALVLELSKYVVKDSDTYVTVAKEGAALPILTKDGHLLQGNCVVNPFTKHENVEGLQKEITDKLPIVSAQEPQSGFVPNQVWLDIGNSNNAEDPLHNAEYEIVDHVNIPNYNDPIIHETVEEHLVEEPLVEELIFDNEENNDNIILIEEGENQ